MLDRYWYGKTSRISPEAPVPVVHVRDDQKCPGGAGNVALNLITLGAKVELFGLIGDDQAGETLKHLLHQHGVVAHLLSQADMPTTTKLRLLSANQQLVRIDFEETIVDVECEALMQACQQKMASANLLILSDYSKGCLNNPQPLIAAARDAALPVLVDPKRLDFSVYRGATLITPNFKEFTAVVGECSTESAILEKGCNLLQQHNFSAILVTRGEHGMTLIEQDGSNFSVAARAPEVYDVTGAGDTVVASLAAALAAGEALPDAVRMANIAAGIVVGRLGAASVTPAELRNTIEQQRETGAQLADAGVVSHQSLQTSLQDCVSRQETVAFIIGEFDVLRAKHLEFLQSIREEYDHIVIGVVSQDLVEAKVVHSLKARQAAIAGFTGVDWVIGLKKADWQAFTPMTSSHKVFFTPACDRLMQADLGNSQELIDFKEETAVESMVA